MKLVLENFGKVREAKVVLSGITVIAGPNKSGKSTIGRALMTLGTALRRMDEAVRDRKVRQLFTRFGEYLGLSAFHISRLRQHVKYDFPLDDLLSSDFWRSEENGKRILDLITKTIPSGRGVTFKDFQGDTEVIIGFLNEVMKQDDLDVARDILDTRFSDVFVGQVNSLLQPDSVASICLTDEGKEKDLVEVIFKNNKLVESRGDLFAMFHKIIYLEPLHLLDFVSRSMPARQFATLGMGTYDRYRAGDCSWSNLMDESGDSSDARDDLPLDEKREIDIVIDEIGAILGGKLGKKEGRLQFRESLYPDSTSFVELENLASGMKSMAVILQVLRNYALRRGMMLVIDEPESNLHPEWQVKFATVLVQLWKRLGVKVLVTTHSPYFLKALEVRAADLNCLGEMKSYMMVPDANGYRMVTKDVSENLNKVFKTFFDPLNNLMSGVSPT